MGPIIFRDPQALVAPSLRSGRYNRGTIGPCVSLSNYYVVNNCHRKGLVALKLKLFILFRHLAYI